MTTFLGEKKINGMKVGLFGMKTVGAVILIFKKNKIEYYTMFSFFRRSS